MRNLHLGSLKWIVGALIVIWLVAQGVFQLYVREAPDSAFIGLNIANLVQMLTTLVAIGLLINSNTRRPEGRDPNTNRDPFASTTEELTHTPFIDDRGKPYGRRQGDDPATVARLIEKLQGQLPEPVEHRPQWAAEILEESEERRHQLETETNNIKPIKLEEL